MKRLMKYSLHPYRIYEVSKKTFQNIGVFPNKTLSDYLDYSVDFSQRLQKGERLISGRVRIEGAGLIVTSVVARGSYLTAFIKGGEANETYYLSYQAQSNLGGSFIQELVMSVVGNKEEAIAKKYSFLILKPGIKPSDTTPPLNALRVNGRYLVTDSGFFMGI